MMLRRWHVVFLLCTLLMVSLPGTQATGQTTEPTGFENLQEDLSAGLITLDQYVIFGIQALITPLAPPRYVPLGLDDDLGTTFLGHWNEITPATRAEVLNLFDRARGDEFTPRVDSIDPVTLAAAAPACIGFNILIDILLECTYATDHFEIRYSVFGLWPVSQVGAEGDGVPDYIENVAENLESALTVYQGLDYDFPNVKLPIHVEIGFMFLPSGTGLVLPDQVIRLSNVDGDTYLPRHELFHVLQYEYGGDNDFTRVGWSTRPGTLWWMEATGEWAAHQASPDGVANEDQYAVKLPDFLGFPDRALDAVVVDIPLVLDNPNPQYGSFIFAEHLEERIDSNVIRQIFERTQQTEFGALRAMELVLPNRGSTLPDELIDFARKSYLMSFLDDDTDGWITILAGDPQVVDRTDFDDLGGPRPYRQERHDLALDVPVSGTVTVERGGRSYIDFLALGDDPGVLEVTISALGDDVYAEVLSFDPYPNECQPPAAFPVGPPPVEVEILIEGDCRHGTLVVTHTDPVEGANADLAWEATFKDVFPAPNVVGVLNSGNGSTFVVPYDPNAIGSLLLTQVIQNSATTISTPAGWTLLSTITGSNYRFSIFYRVSDNASPQQVTFVTGQTAVISAHMTEITNWHGSSPPEISAGVTGISATPNSGLVTASWGGGPNLFLTLIGLRKHEVVYFAPEGWTREWYGGNSSGLGFGQGSLRSFGASADPGPWTIGIQSTFPWAAYTVVVRGNDSP